jgi:hypothetical protein
MTLCFANSHFVNIKPIPISVLAGSGYWEPKFKLEFEPFSEFTTLTIIQKGGTQVPVEGGIIIHCGFSLGCAFANVSLYVAISPTK